MSSFDAQIAILTVNYYQIQKNMKISFTGTLLCLFFYMIETYTDILMVPYNPLPSGQPHVVIRKTPIRVRYTLVEDKYWQFIGYPELNDRFTLNYAQRVNIWYNGTGSFWTGVKINGNFHQQLYVMTMSGYERTLHAWDDVWLQKGTYYISVEYMNTGKVRDHPPNSAGHRQMGLLKIQYVDYAQN